MSRAKELLLTETRKVREVATLVGFKDEFYFSRSFKKMVGISPRHYAAKKTY